VVDVVFLDGFEMLDQLVSMLAAADQTWRSRAVPRVADVFSRRVLFGLIDSDVFKMVASNRK